MTQESIPDLSAQPKNERTNYEKKLKLWELILKAVTSLGLVVGGIWAIGQYIDAKIKEQDQQNKEYELMLYNQRKDVYQPLCKAAGEIVSSKTMREAEPSIKVFLSLHWGGVVVMDNDVSQSKQAFCEALLDFMNGQGDAPPPTELTFLATDLSKKCSESLAPEKIYGTKSKKQ